MTVFELIGELMATAQHPEDEVLFVGEGEEIAEPILKVSTVGGVTRAVYLNDYPVPREQK